MNSNYGSSDSSCSIQKNACQAKHTCGLPEVDPQRLASAKLALSRRSFVRTFALLTAASWAGGKELKSLLVAEVAAQSSTLPGVFRMNLDNFPLLQQEVGSVRLSVTGMPTSFRQIIVTRLEGSQFFAVTSQCTHQAQPVSAMNLTTRLLRCPTHGSQYDPDGTVVNGPANQALARYETSFDGDKTLSVIIPGLGFQVTVGDAVNPANSQKRIRLEFPTVNAIRYRIQFRASLADGEWAEVPFAITVDGASTQTVLVGNNTKATVFVEPSTGFGFYAVTRANS